ncbi:hypothetical protein C8R46DRAFT_1214914 [Mycena filopes]|nr:hypothetical protein C8R46DRAFT_1214914 [Mycena filopes]
MRTVSKKRTTKRARTDVARFFDLSAMQDNGFSDDSDEDETEFIDRRDKIDDEELPALGPPRVRLAFDTMEEDPQEIAARLEERYRRMSIFKGKEKEDDTGNYMADKVIKWVHTPDNCPAHSTVPIWRLVVRRGKERDVVFAIMAMSKPGGNHPLQDAGVLSATAHPYARGFVYVECASIATIDRIVGLVAFVRRGAPPEQIKLSDYKAIMSVVDKPAIPDGSWARYAKRGVFCGDLVWVEAYDPARNGYTVAVVPRPPLVVDANFASSSKRRRSGPRPAQSLVYPLDGDDLLESLKVFEFESDKAFSVDRRRVHHGLYVAHGVPLSDLVDDRVGPSKAEYDIWAQSPLCSASLALSAFADMSRLFSRSMGVLRELVDDDTVLRSGDRVRVVQGVYRDAVGRAVDVDVDERVVLADVVHLSGPRIQYSFPFACIAFEYRGGDVVEVRDGLHAGLYGWVTAVDWGACRVDLVEYRQALPLDADSPVLEWTNDAGTVLEWTISMSAIRLKPLSFSPPSVSTVVPGPSSPSVPRSRMDTFLHVEVKFIRGPYRTLFGIVKSTHSDGDHLTVRTEGRAINSDVIVKQTDVRERHTGMTLSEYMMTPSPIALRLRKYRETIWAAEINPDILPCAPDAASVPLADLYVDNTQPPAVDPAWLPDGFVYVPPCPPEVVPVEDGAPTDGAPTAPTAPTDGALTDGTLPEGTPIEGSASGPSISGLDSATAVAVAGQSSQSPDGTDAPPSASS